MPWWGRGCCRTALVRAVREQVSPVPDQGAVEQFVATGLDPALHNRVHPGHLNTTQHDLDASVVEVHDKVADGLGHPCRGRMWCRAEATDPALRTFDHYQHVHPDAGQRDGF